MTHSNPLTNNAESLPIQQFSKQPVQYQQGSTQSTSFQLNRWNL